jgi:glutamate-5-semialdehyde dehydrogenase
MNFEAITSQLETLKQNSATLASLSSEVKNRILLNLAEQLQLHRSDILAENKKDVEEFQKSDAYTVALGDRLLLTERRIEGMRESLKQIAHFSDPVGKIESQKVLANGLVLKQVRSPLGVIFMIFESRPNVITEAFSIALKSGNSLIMKGGKESSRTSSILYSLIHKSLAECDLDADTFVGLVGVDRETTDYMMTRPDLIDVLIPRGGERLIEHVTKNSHIPIIKNDRGLCHVYVHSEADFKKALAIVVNAKTHRPAVCNAMETLLIDSAIGGDFLNKLKAEPAMSSVQYFCCEKSLPYLQSTGAAQAASDRAYATEYSDLKMNVKIVSTVSEALQHIGKYGSHHSEVIVTEDLKVARDFQQKVDAAVVYWNASSRFTDGFEFGLGGEIGISTQKLHVRGPVGVEALTSLRWIVDGNGQVRS